MIDYIEFTGNDAFYDIFRQLFGDNIVRKTTTNDSDSSIRVYFPRKNDDIVKNKNYDDYDDEEDEDEEEYDEEDEEYDESESEDDEEDEYPPYDYQMNHREMNHREPPSIFDSDNFDRIFSKATKKNNTPPPAKTTTTEEHPFVFIANRLTFLIYTRYPIIWDTSTVTAVAPDCIFIALDKHNNPKIDISEATRIAHEINLDCEIEMEIQKFLEKNNQRYRGIYVTPWVKEINGERRLGFLFALIRRK